MRADPTCHWDQAFHSPQAICPYIDRLIVTGLQQLNMWWPARLWADYTMTTDLKSGPRNPGIGLRPIAIEKELFNERSDM